MRVSQLMHKQLITCSPDSSIREAALKMKQNSIGSMLVVEEGSIKGILTDRDIALSVAGDLKNPQNTPVKDIMSGNPVTIQADADLESALKIMSSRNVRRLPVTQNGRVVGILSSADVGAEIQEEFDEFMQLEQAYAKAA